MMKQTDYLTDLIEAALHLSMKRRGEILPYLLSMALLEAREAAGTAQDVKQSLRTGAMIHRPQ